MPDPEKIRIIDPRVVHRVKIRLYNFVGASAGGGGGSGTVTSVAMTVPTGLSVSGSPITSSGTLAVSLASGYSIPTTANQTNWSTAYGWGDHSAAGYLTGIGSETLDDLSDVTITANSAGEILKWNGSAWVNNTLAEANIAAADHTHAQLHDAATVSGNGISITGQQISLSIGTGATQVASGDHNHSGVYQPLDSDLTAIAGLSSADGNFIVGSALGWVVESGATARTSLGLGTAATAATGDFEAAGAVSTHAALTSGIHGISTFGANLIDDANAAAARTTLGVDAAGTDNSTPVTLAGSLDYLTISGQVITRNAIDLAADVTGDLPFANLAQASAASKLLGRGSAAGAGDYEEISLGSGLTMTGTTLSASASAPALDDVTDVTITAVADNELLAYNSGTGDWINQTAAEAGFATVATSGSASDLSTGTLPAARLGADSIDAITEIAAALKTGADGKVVTGTAGTSGNLVSWDANGDAVDASIVAANVKTTRTGVYREVWIGAGAMTPRTTNGAAAATVELATNDVMLDVLDFDTTTEEGAGFVLSLPGVWDAGTVKAKVYWTAASGSGGVAWGLRARANADDDAMDSAFGTEQVVTDSLITANDCHITSATSAITIGNTPAVDDLIVFEITREVANGSDTLAVDARLIGIKLQYLESSTEPSAW